MLACSSEQREYYVHILGQHKVEKTGTAWICDNEVTWRNRGEALSVLEQYAVTRMCKTSQEPSQIGRGLPSYFIWRL